ncbi:MAG: hypothetical protein IPK72_00540 [Candidatus Eisenbacteria bacterium]|nr:hypothetical protein [Candidatus Eisenbacteria bacterium]
MEFDALHFLELQTELTRETAGAGASATVWDAGRTRPHEESQPIAQSAIGLGQPPTWTARNAATADKLGAVRTDYRTVCSEAELAQIRRRVGSGDIRVIGEGPRDLGVRHD